MTDSAAFAAHGGALDAARRLFPKATLPWIDLSTGINPVAYPVEGIRPEDWARLPDATSLARLEHVAAARYRMPSGACIVAAPGTQAIIQRLPGLVGGRDIRILGPTYSEFALVFGGADARVRIVPSLEALAGADTAIVVNPNNPDGRLEARDDLLRLAPRVGTLVVDEAFSDGSVPDHSVIPCLHPARTIVLRSFGKFYGLAGLRLGFAITSLERGEALRRMFGPWAVGGPAIAVGARALADDAWAGETCARLREDGRRLAYLLGHVGATPIGATPLFRLISHPVAPQLFRALADHGILTRPFADARHRLRFGLPGSETEWARLESALVAFR